MPSPKKKAGCSQSPTPSVPIYFPGKIAFNVFSDLALNVKQCFLQQLKRFAPQAEDDITNIRQEAEKIYETLSSFQADHLELKNTVETCLTEAKQYLKLKAQLQDRTTTIEVQNKRATLLSKLGEAQASVEKVEAQFDEATTSIAQAHKRRKLLETELEQAKANEWVLHGKLVETEASLKKAKDDVSFLEREITDLDAAPRVTAEDIA